MGVTAGESRTPWADYLAEHKEELRRSKERLRRSDNILRAWFIAYGVGGLVVLVSREPIFQSLRESGFFLLATGLFFAGVAFQIFLGILHKKMDQFDLRVAEDPLTMGDKREAKASRVGRVQKALQWAWWDILTVILYAAATIVTIVSLSSGGATTAPTMPAMP